MSDPLRFDGAAPPDRPGARTGRAEALLVEGLDQYFAGRYEEAIHIWTRVLFLDRSHARARAYIDRARTALAERQRRADELLQASRDLLEQGRTSEARHKLTEAVAETGEDDRASALRARLERLERTRASARPDPAGRASVAEAVSGWTWPRRSTGLALVVTAAALALVLLAAAANSAVRQWLDGDVAGEALVTADSPAPLPVLSSSEAALVRARTLYKRERYAEALKALDRVNADSPVHLQADQLRVAIQQLLLAGQLERTRGSQGPAPQ